MQTLQTNAMPQKIIPINSLNAYMHSWTIKARIISKRDIRTFTNSKGVGQVFSFDVLDNENTEIHITCFNTQALHFHPSIQIGKVYLISRGLIKPINKEYNHLENEWEITLDNTSVIEPSNEDDHLIANHNFKFTPINELSTLPTNSVVDILGLAISISQVTTILRKNGTETQKRTLELKDMSGCSVDLTLWGCFVIKMASNKIQLPISFQ
jgi:replication factor A1